MAAAAASFVTISRTRPVAPPVPEGYHAWGTPAVIRAPLGWKSGDPIDPAWISLPIRPDYVKNMDTYADCCVDLGTGYFYCLP